MSALPIVVDTDPGVDDAAALLVALASPELDVRAITTVGGNVPLEVCTRNALKIVEATGRTDVPVHAGCPGPLVRDQVFGRYVHVGGFADDVLPPPRTAPAEGHAVEVIARAAREGAATGRPITLACLGPLTNVALALVQDATVAAGIARIVVMGGAFTALGHRTAWAEFNVFADPHATAAVYASGVPVVVLPLDATFRGLVTNDDVAAFARDGGVPGAALATLLRRYDRSDVARFGRPGAPLHDAMVPTFLVAPELFRGRPAHVGVECQGTTPGHTWADFWGKSGRPANATVVEEVDEAGFRAFLCERIARWGR